MSRMEYRDGSWKKGFALTIILLLVFAAGYYMGSRTDVHYNGDGVDRVRNDIRSTQDAAAGTAESLDRAADANQDAQDTARDIGDTNQKLQNSVAGSADEIECGQQILSRIRGRGQTGQTAP